MSGDSRDYYRYSRSDERGLPPLREIVGDALDKSPVSPYRFDFDNVNQALPGASKPQGRYPNPGAYYPQRGPTLPPIRQFTSRSHSSYSTSTPSRSMSRTPHHDRRSEEVADTAAVHTYPAISNPQPVTGPSAYSFNVLRAQQGDLVDVRTPSSRAQGILRPTAIIEDEDESHKRYKCDWPGCEKKYDRPSSLEVHRHTHTGSQPYPCQYPGCPRAFNVKSNMLRHFRSHPKPQTSQTSVSREEEEESDSDGEDGADKWPAAESSSSRYFHTSSSSRRQPSSLSQAPTSSGASASSSAPNKYYSSSGHR